MLDKCNVPDTICDKPDTGSQDYAPCMADSADTRHAEGGHSPDARRAAYNRGLNL
jgi:hypothetical protein